MINVLVTNSGYPVSSKFVKSVVVSFLQKEGLKDCEVSISVIAAPKMKKLSEKYLGNGFHGVLSFPFEDPLERPGGHPGFPLSPDGILRLGDIVISYPDIQKAANEEGKLVDEKVKELLEHGLEHLLGRHHE